MNEISGKFIDEEKSTLHYPRKHENPFGYYPITSSFTRPGAFVFFYLIPS